MAWKILERFRARPSRRRAQRPLSFSRTGAEEEASEREEYGLPDSGEAQLRTERFRGLASDEAAELELDELGELKRPPDPNP